MLLSVCSVFGQGSPVMHPLGEANYPVQGLRSNTLVAGKITALRFFTDPVSIANIKRIDVSVTRPDGSTIGISWATNNFVAIPSSSLGPSVVGRIPGASLPWTGTYSQAADLIDQNGQVLAHYSSVFQLLPTKDLRVIVDRIRAGSVNPGTTAEIQGAISAIERMSFVYPIRDGTNTLDGDRVSGLRYLINNNPSPQDSQLCPLLASWANRPSNVDSVDVGIAFRAPDPGEGCGGNAPHFCSGQTVPYSVIVWAPPISQVFCQETCHGFGLEPPNDPHFDPNVQAGHSKDYVINALDAELGFDCQFNRPFPNPTYDIMFPTGPCPGWIPQNVSLNSWDWEYLRQRLANLPSTGPTNACFDGAPVLSVPSQYSTVRAAYNAAQDCNIIRINVGTYQEAPFINLTKHVRLESQGGPATIR